MSETLIDIDPVKDAEAKKDFERLYDEHAKRKKEQQDAITSIQSILRPPSSNTAQSNTA
jgi:hypothetical protein|tara:strand:+ start:340 stop:516 length:177 start_codon:yes stop_codon:yes gene_type:complete